MREKAKERLIHEPITQWVGWENLYGKARTSNEKIKYAKEQKKIVRVLRKIGVEFIPEKVRAEMPAFKAARLQKRKKRGL